MAAQEGALKAQDFARLNQIIETVCKASFKLLDDKMGIGYEVDLKMGTNKHIFCIVGDHRGVSADASGCCGGMRHV